MNTSNINFNGVYCIGGDMLDYTVVENWSQQRQKMPGRRTEFKTNEIPKLSEVY